MAKRKFPIIISRLYRIGILLLDNLTTELIWEKGLVRSPVTPHSEHPQLATCSVSRM